MHTDSCLPKIGALKKGYKLCSYSEFPNNSIFVSSALMHIGFEFILENKKRTEVFRNVDLAVTGQSLHITLSCKFTPT